MKRLILILCVGLFLGGSVWGLTAEEQMRFADGIYLRGFYESAVGEYLLLLRDYPGSEYESAALYRTGECYRQMGNLSGAERFYKRVATEYPKGSQTPRAALRRAEIALSEGRPEDSKGLLKELLKGKADGETKAAATYQLGSSYLKADQIRGATTTYKGLLKEYPDSPYAAYAALDLAAIQSGKKDNRKQMEAWFERAVQTAGTPSVKAEALFRWGDWAYREGRYQAAADTLQALLVELPEERRAKDARLATAWSLYYLNRTPEALQLAEQMIADAAEPETAASGEYLRANCLRKMNRDGEALMAYESVTQDYPGTSFAERAAYEIMVTHFKRGQYEKALVAAPAQPDPANEVDVLWMRAEAERQLGRTDLARGRYETLSRDYSGSDQAASSLLRLGEMAREAGRMDEASDLFRRMAEEYPENPAVPEAWKASALARLRSGDATGALKDWDQVLEGDADDESRVEAQLQRVLVLIELKKSAKALKALDELIENAPKGEQTARAYYWRGVLLSEKSKWELSEADLRSSLSASPDAQIESLARLRLAVVLQRLGRMDEAADQIEPLLADPRRVAENPALVEWLVRRRFEQGQYAGALAAATALADSAAEASWRQIGWHWAGASQSQLGKEPQALAFYEKAVAEDAATREGAESQLLLAGLELKAGHLDRAMERYADAAESARGEQSLDLRARAYFGLGEAAEANGLQEKAARHFMSVAVLFDDSEWTPHCLFRAGMLFGQTGQTEKQNSAWAELTARYPASSFAKQVESLSP
jgi:TolA-binding protein